MVGNVNLNFLAMFPLKKLTPLKGSEAGVRLNMFFNHEYLFITFISFYHFLIKIFGQNVQKRPMLA